MEWRNEEIKLNGNKESKWNKKVEQESRDRNEGQKIKCKDNKNNAKIVYRRWIKYNKREM